MRYLLIILSFSFLNANWESKYFVDEFGDLTNNAYITSTQYGVFSNSATTNSTLKVKFLIEKDEVAIQLYEYGGTSPVKTSGSSKEYRIKIKVNDEVYETYGHHLGNRLSLGNWRNREEKSLELIKTILNNETIKFKIYGTYSDEYSFDLKSDNFAEVYTDTYPNYDIDLALEKIDAQHKAKIEEDKLFEKKMLESNEEIEKHIRIGGYITGVALILLLVSLL